jgi:hypothetical protein
LRENDFVISVIPHTHPITKLFAENGGTETESLFRHPFP